MGQEWEKGTLQAATGVSLRRVVLGFLVGAAVALVLAAVAGCRASARTSSTRRCRCCARCPTSGSCRCWCCGSASTAPKITLIALGVAFPLYVNTVAGIRGVDATYLDAARAMRLSWAARLRHVIVPGALPSVLVGLRLSLGVAGSR